MTQRERHMVVVLAGILCIGLTGLAIYRWFYKPLSDYNAQIGVLETDLDKKEGELNGVLGEKKTLLDRWRPMSLPANPDQAANEYGQYLRNLLTRLSGMSIDEFVAPPPFDAKPAASLAKKAGHIVLTFTVRGKGTLNQVVDALKTFQETALMHRVKNLTLSRLDRSEKAALDPNPKLSYVMVVEGMIVNNANRKDSLFSSAGPKNLSPETSWREYAQMERKNVFAGRAPLASIVKKDEDAVDPRQYLQLVSTTPTSNQAHLRNRLTGFNEIRVGTDKGFQYFRVMDETSTHEILKAKVLKVDLRDVYFMVKEDAYVIHIGDTLAQAMRHQLSDDELTAAGLRDTFYNELRNLDETKKEQGKKKPGKKN